MIRVEHSSLDLLPCGFAHVMRRGISSDGEEDVETTVTSVYQYLIGVIRGTRKKHRLLEGRNHQQLNAAILPVTKDVKGHACSVVFRQQAETGRRSPSLESSKKCHGWVRAEGRQ